jgi:proprotein convertase subtilisin/kexin type 5
MIFLNFKFFFKTCVSDCESSTTGSYGNVEERICKACDISCLFCTEGDNLHCSECKENYLLFNETDCLGTCPDGYWGDVPNKVCLECIDNCNTCS